MPIPFFILPLAEVSPEKLKELGKAFVQPAGENRYLPPAWTFAALVVLLVLALTGMWLWERYKKTREQSTPFRVFRRIARELGLGLSDQLFLARIAHQQRLPSPLTLIFSHATLDHPARLYAAGLVEFRRAGVLDRVARIRDRLAGA